MERREFKCDGCGPTSDCTSSMTKDAPRFCLRDGTLVTKHWIKVS